MERDSRRQPHRPVPVLPGVRRAHAGGRPRLHRQHRVDHRPAGGHAGPGALRREQGRHRRPDPRARGRVGRSRRPRERAPARPGADADGRARDRAGGDRRAGGHRPDAGGPLGRPPRTSRAPSSSSAAPTPASSTARRSSSTAATRPTARRTPQPDFPAMPMPELHGQRYSRAELSRRVGRLEQAAGVRLVTLGDGVERGVRLLEFRTGTGFEFDVVVDRAFDIGRCEHAGRALAWTLGDRLRRPVVLRARRPRLLPRVRRRPADHMRPRPRAVHGRGHGRAVPLPAEADRDVRPARPRLQPARAPRRIRASAGKATSVSSTRRARSSRPRSSASSCFSAAGSRRGSASHVS